MLKLVTAPTGQAVSTAEAKLWAKVDVTDDDALIDSMIAAATLAAEHLMGRAILSQSWQLVLPSFYDPTVWTEPVPITIDAIRGPTYAAGTSALNLARPTVSAVTFVKYLDPATGTLTTVASSDYVLNSVNDYTARLVPAYGKTWPSTRAMPDAVTVEFVCGWTNAAAVPEPVKNWIKLRVAGLYQNRSAWTLGKSIEPNAFLDSLLDRYRVWSL